MGVIDFILALMQDMILSAIPALGFAMVFNVPHRALPWCALLGALGHGSRMVMMTAGFNIEWSTFMASLLVGCIGIQWSRWYLAHPKVFTVAAIIPMIPGVHAYKAMIAIVQIHHYGFSDKLFEQMISSFINTSFILGALVLGLALPGLLFYRQKPVV